MRDIIITGASRGIGQALSLALAAAADTRIVLVARDEAKLNDVARWIEEAGGSALCVPGDLASLDGARDLGRRLADVVRRPATLVHNAGIWPHRRELTPDGLESSFVVNFIGPLLTQQPLLERRLISRVMVVSAYLIVQGRYSAERTPTGKDFSTWRTYCTTKLALAVAERDMAAKHPEVDFIILHPGIVRTELGTRRGLSGTILKFMKRTLESPEHCASRLKKLLNQDRWSNPGEAKWMFEDKEKPWLPVTNDERLQQAVRNTMTDFLTTPTT